LDEIQDFTYVDDTRFMQTSNAEKSAQVLVIDDQKIAVLSPPLRQAHRIIGTS
jgi:hypothetical protein